MKNVEIHERPFHCTICLREKARGMDTCGRSECQEAAYYRSRANSMRRGTSKRLAADNVASEKLMAALRAGDRKA